MITTLRRIGLIGALLALYAAPANAQTVQWNDAGELYGRGVHAYFAGQYDKAETYLSQSLAINPSDPRAFYFRALARMRVGRTYEAREDMQLGASIEAEQPGRRAVGAALQRVQGAERLTLEKYRRQARSNAGIMRQQSRIATSQQFSDESQYLYQPVIVPLQEFLSDNEPRALTAEELEQRARIVEPRFAPSPPYGAAPAATNAADPFRDDSAAPIGPAATPAAPPAEERATEPLVNEDAMAEEEMPSQVGPSLDAPAPEAEVVPEDAAAPDDDPFSDL